MGKKRIFELAKELGYQNRDLIDQLQKLGFDVKSHSSTIEEDEVRTALSRAEEDRKARTDERRVSRTVIRRRSKETSGREGSRSEGGGATTVVRRARTAAPAADSNGADRPSVARPTPEESQPARPKVETRRRQAEDPPASSPSAEARAARPSPEPQEAPAAKEREPAPKTEAKAPAAPADASKEPAPPQTGTGADPSSLPEADRPEPPRTSDETIAASVQPGATSTETSREALSASEAEETPAPSGSAPTSTAQTPAVGRIDEAVKGSGVDARKTVESTTAGTEQEPAAAASAVPEAETPAVPPSVEADDQRHVTAEETRAVDGEPTEGRTTPSAEATGSSTASSAVGNDKAAVDRPETDSTAAPDERPQARAGAEDEEEEERARRDARSARPDRRARDEYLDEDDEKPDFEDFGFDEFDFGERPEDEKGARVAPPPPSSPAVNPQKQAETETRVVRRIDPNVLKARLKQSKRPDPPKEWGKEPVPASPVTELVVRTDSTGKRKELVDVRKEAAKGKRGNARRKEEMSAKDLLEHRRGQVYYPAPNRKRPTKKRPKQRQESVQPLVKQPISIGETITVNDLSQQMSVKATQIIQWLMRQGVMAGINQPIDHDTAAMVAMEMGYEVQSLRFVEEEHLAGPSADDAAQQDENAQSRAPVVTVMGHVDHGKTSLLDRIRKANVAAGEAGGITQRIAGYQVGTSNGDVTFLDTPGHAAFSQMRARGANVTDIIILVVAADDGVMPQTREAIEHARSANVPLIVAVNKIDKPDANPDRVLQQLADHQILVEEWGGDVLMRKISAKTGEGIEELLEQLALQSEIMELKANPDVPAVGAVIEGHIHKGRGPVATVLIQEGTLRKGDIVVAGECLGKVRAMMTDGGKTVKEAGPSMPVEILGLDGVPNPGDELRVAQDNAAAKELVAHRRERRRAAELGGTSKVSLQDLFARASAGEQKELKVVVKADVQGSVEALKDALTGLSTQKVRVSVISGAVGAVTESDVEFALASEAIIIGFGVRPDTKALKAARSSGVDIRTYNIIYEAVDEVKLAMRGLLAPVEKEKYLGRAEVRQTFNVPKVGVVAGCAVVDGIITRNANVRLLRDSRPIYDGRLASLKRFKDDVREVREGFECGMGIERFNDIKEGDIIEAYEMVMTEAALDEPVGEGEGTEARP
ncbi:MAG: translation initiation factor IF-2 [Myxococcota bacterium]